MKSVHFKIGRISGSCILISHVQRETSSINRFASICIIICIIILINLDGTMHYIIYFVKPIYWMYIIVAISNRGPFYECYLDRHRLYIMTYTNLYLRHVELFCEPTQV